MSAPESREPPQARLEDILSNYEWAPDAQPWDARELAADARNECDRLTAMLCKMRAAIGKKMAREMGNTRDCPEDRRRVSQMIEDSERAWTMLEGIMRELNELS